MININAEILPWKGLGGVTLNSNINSLKQILDSTEIIPSILGKYIIKYQLNDTIEFWFNILNGKLFKITALQNYSGTLWNSISIGMDMAKIQQLKPEFVYEDFEEIYISKNGVIIETDPTNNKILWISVFIREMLEDGFENGVW